MTRKLLLLIVCGLFALSVTAASTDAILVPVQLGTILGSHGAVWNTTLTVCNVTNDEIYMASDSPPVVVGIPPHSTLENPVSAGGRWWTLSAPGLHFRLRVQSLSPGASDVGADLPVAHEDEFAADGATFVGVRLSEAMRTRFRVYFLLNDAFDGGEATVTVTDAETHSPVATRTVSFRGNGLTRVWLVDIPLDEVTIFRGVVNVNVDPKGHRAWGIVSETSNATNDVTVIRAQ